MKWIRDQQKEYCEYQIEDIHSNWIAKLKTPPSAAPTPALGLLGFAASCLLCLASLQFSQILYRSTIVL